MQAMKCAAVLSVVAAGAVGAAGARGQNLVGSYFFDGTFNSSTEGASSLIPHDPLGLNAFTTEFVFGVSRSVYVTNGDEFPSEFQAGFALETEGWLSPQSYSVEMVFKFHEKAGQWRRILDTQDRLSDLGFYVEPENHLRVHSVATGTGETILDNEYHHVVLTVEPEDSSNRSLPVVKAFLDGALQLETMTDIMNLSNASQGLLNIFLDNVEGGGVGEYSDATIAVLRLYDAALSPERVIELAREFIQAPCPCDLNVDGIVDDADFVIFVMAYNILDCEDQAMESGCPADFNADGLVEDEDFVVFVAAYNELLCP